MADKMNKKLNLKYMTEAAVLSAASVCLNIMLIGSGLGSFGYIDFIIPIITVLIIMKCDIKYALLSSIVTLVTTMITIGNLVILLYIFQSMMIGFIIGVVLNIKKNSFSDNILIASFFSCMFMIIFDINFSGILGVSILQESSEILKTISLEGEIKDVFYYYTIISVPLGTTIITYVVSVFLGKKLNILNDRTKCEVKEFLSYKKTMPYIVCSSLYFNAAAISIFIFDILNRLNIKIERLFYLNIFITSLRYILIFILFVDSIRVIMIFLRKRYKSRLLLILFEILIFYLAFRKFTISVYILILTSIIIDMIFSIRQKSRNYIEYILKNDI
ncbi:DUF2232 domain-containing protein [Clostridium sp. BJN0001]|uniref:DUF2232 domain-containing protein n=1 Tax=Clostridium sp. BJN0001 TaxID=2930219 RepID=UPI001FD072A5|nr:DUF2232 domain-containing protein [Clostridium sp. BJN0001]